MNEQKRIIAIVLAVGLIAAAFMISNRWKKSTAVLKTPKTPQNRSAMAKKPVDRVEFLTEVFKDIKPTENVARLLQKDPRSLPEDSLEVILKWSLEARIDPLTVMIESDLAMKNPTEENMTTAARNLISAATQYQETPIISAWMFQQGKIIIDKGMALNDKNIPLRNALITYISEFENEPMKFLTLLRETLALDSNNVETHFIHLNLLFKSEQWEKAIEKCKKLISLQPQNPEWLFRMSHIYGMTGDSTNAKVYKDLAVRVQKKQKSN